MTPLAALAAAARDRLMAGAIAPLPGIGTLVRVHVSARVHVSPDGARMLLPPGEAIGLSPNAGDPTDLASALVRLSGAPPQTSAAALRTALDQFEARLAIVGEARLDGVGVFQRTSGGVRFAPDPDLLAAVNGPFEGLAPVAAVLPTPSPAPAARAAAPAWSPPPVPDAPPDAVDILLDLIVNEPAETPADSGPADVAEPGSAPASVAATASVAAVWADEADIRDALPDTEAAVPASGETHDALRDDAPLHSSTPSDSTFADDPSGDDEPDDDEPGDDEPGLAVPFGDPGDGTDLRDRLPPTAAGHEADRSWQTHSWDPDAHAPGDAPRPIGLPDDGIEDADYLDVSPPRLADPPEMARDDAPLDEALVAGPDVPAAYLLSTSEPPLGDSAAAASDGADPPRTSFHEDPPAAVASTADEAPTLRRARRSWIALLAVLALALASFLLWRSRQAEPARALAPPAVPSATPRQAADTLGGRPTGDDSAATSTFADSSAAAVTPIDDALATPPPLPEPAAPQPAGRPTPGAAAPTVRAAPPVAARQPGDSRGLPPDLRLAILPVRIAGLPPADAQALAGGVVRPSSGAFTWVVLSTPARADADALAERYRTAGYRTGVLTASQRGSAVFRVGVGAFDSREQAFRLRDRLPPQAPPDTWPLDLRAL